MARGGYKTKRQMLKAKYRVVRPVVRQQAYDRDGGRCVWPTCCRVVQLEADDPYQLANAHELRPRSLGGDPLDVNQVVTTCWTCHMGLHPQVGGKTKRISGGTTVREELSCYERRKGDVWELVGILPARPEEQPHAGD